MVLQIFCEYSRLLSGGLYMLHTVAGLDSLFHLREEKKNEVGVGALPVTAPFAPINVRTAMIRAESVSPGHDSHWNVSPLYIIYITVYAM